MSAELVVITWPTDSGEKFMATVKVRGEYFDADSESPNGVFVAAAATDHSLHQALKYAGIEPYSLHGEHELRAAFEAIGLSRAEIDVKFAAARRWKTSMTTRH